MTKAQRRQERISPSGSNQPFGIKLDSDVLWKGVGFRAVFMAPLLIVGVYNQITNPAAPIATGIVVGLGVVIGLVAIAMMTVSVQLTESSVQTRRLIGLRRVIPRHEIERGVFAAQYNRFGDNLSALFVLRGRDQKNLLSLSGQTFSAGSLKKLAYHIGIDRFEMIDYPMDAGTLAESYPGIAPYWERRPIAFTVWGFVIVMVIIIVISTIAVVTGAAR